MTYKTIQANIVGSSNPSRSKAFSQERTLNMYPEVSQTGAYPSVLYPWLGSVSYSDGTGLGEARGCYTHSDGTFYKVTDTTLYSMASDGSEAAIGSIPGSGYVVMADDGNNLLLATTTAAYQYNGSTLTQVTDPDYEAGGSVDVILNQAVWQGNNQRFAVATAGDPDDIASDFYATAEAKGDDLVRVYVFNETLYLMGSQTMEPWYYSGSGSPPFDRIQAGTKNVGLIGRLAIDSNDNFMYWIGEDKNLYRASAYDPAPLMPASIHKEFTTYDLTSCRVRCLTFDGQNFVMILTDSKSWVYSETTGAWLELSYKADEQIYLAYDYAYAYNKHFIMSRIDSRILELDQSVYTDNGEITIRERVTAPINAATLGINGARLTMKRAELIMESGIGNASQSDPLVMMSHSVDFGQTWSKEVWIRAGRDGENNLRVEYYAMASFRQIQFKIRTSDPNFFTFQSLALDVKRGGNY